MLWLACAVIVVLAGCFVLTPLFAKPKDNLKNTLIAETELDRLLSRKTAVYSNLKDLEFEYAMGRLSDADFQTLGAAYKSEAASILQRLDQLDAPENADEEIEKDIALRKSKLYGAGAKEVQDASSCPSCGAKCIPGKKFCADCGYQF